MTTNPVSSIYTAPTNDRVAAKTLGQQDFIKLLTAQLANQNVFKPQDSGAMLGQMTQIASIQSMSMMQTDLKQMQTDQKIALGQSLINQFVEVQDINGGLVTGLVDKVALTDGVPQLIINGQPYPVASLQSVFGALSPTP